VVGGLRPHETGEWARLSLLGHQNFDGGRLHVLFGVGEVSFHSKRTFGGLRHPGTDLFPLSVTHR
jgi:hypothetical protein